MDRKIQTNRTKNRPTKESNKQTERNIDRKKLTNRKKNWPTKESNK
jgi:hypothetical protein